MAFGLVWMDGFSATFMVFSAAGITGGSAARPTVCASLLMTASRCERLTRRKRRVPFILPLVGRVALGESEWRRGGGSVRPRTRPDARCAGADLSRREEGRGGRTLPAANKRGLDWNGSQRQGRSRPLHRPADAALRGPAAGPWRRALF